MDGGFTPGSQIRLSVPEPRGNAEIADNYAVLVDGEVTAGNRELTEKVTVCGREFEYGVDAGGFWQMHRHAPIALTGHVMSLVHGELDGAASACLWDLYSGSGLFTLPLATLSAGRTRMLSVEGGKTAVKHAQRNLRAIHLGNVDARVGDVAKTLANVRNDLAKPDIVVLDPPRAGARAKVCSRSPNPAREASYTSPVTRHRWHATPPHWPRSDTILPIFAHSTSIRPPTMSKRWRYSGKPHDDRFRAACRSRSPCSRLRHLHAGRCTPNNAAVGDTQSAGDAVAHSIKDRNSLDVAMIGSQDEQTDRLTLDAMEAGGLRPVYLPVAGTVDMQDTARQAVEDMAQRMVSIIVISGIDVSGVNHDGWYDTLTTARQAGIPVALLNPIATPTDSTLFAATLTINDRMTDATPLADAVAGIANNDPHDRTILVTTISHGGKQ